MQRRSPLNEAADFAARKSVEAALHAENLERASREAKEAEDEVRRLQQEEVRSRMWQTGLTTVSSAIILFRNWLQLAINWFKNKKMLEMSLKIIQIKVSLTNYFIPLTTSLCFWFC